MTTSLDVVTYGEAMTMFVAAETGDLAKVGQFTKRVDGHRATFNNRRR